MAASGLCSRTAQEQRMTATIFALASGSLPCAIAIVRVSGPVAFAVLATMIRGPLPPPGRLVRRDLHDRNGVCLDPAMVVCFCGPRSATGDDIVELHLHGGVAIVNGVTAELRRQGAIDAGPGAFTRRAFDNGKVALGQVEALGDLLAAETDGQRRLAISRMTGSGDEIDRWRSIVMGVRANIEVALDFAEIDVVGDGLSEHDRGALATVADEVSHALASSARAAQLRTGITIAIIGDANVGKSTLFNALLGRDAALTDTAPGTTRDVIEGRLLIAGIPVTLIDTAGVRQTDSRVEAAGIARGQQRGSTSDIVIAVGGEARAGSIAVISKCDTIPHAAGWAGDRLYLSATTGDGIEQLRVRLNDDITTMSAAVSGAHFGGHGTASLAEAHSSLTALHDLHDPILIAEELRAATIALERLLERRSDDEVLDAVFSRFCIGK